MSFDSTTNYVIKLLKFHFRTHLPALFNFGDPKVGGGTNTLLVPEPRKLGGPVPPSPNGGCAYDHSNILLLQRR